VTGCIEGRECLLGEVSNNTVHLSPAGQTVARAWEDLPKHYPHVRLDAFVVMPNHIHGVLELQELEAVRRHPLPEVLPAFKSFSSRRINKRRGTPGVPVWQRDFHDRIIRDQEELEAIRRYIAENPAKWSEDPENQS
jgi:REP-associated tyrosine transposase